LSLLALPEIAWESSRAVYVAWKGFAPMPAAEPDMTMNEG
jgi:hypothetical protein